MCTKSIFLTHPLQDNPGPPPYLPLRPQTPQPCDRKEEEEQRPKEAPGKLVLTPDPPPRQTFSQASVWECPVLVPLQGTPDQGWQTYYSLSADTPHTYPRGLKPVPSLLLASPYFLGLL